MYDFFLNFGVVTNYSLNKEDNLFKQRRIN